MPTPELTGRIPPERIHLFAVPRPPDGVVEGLQALEGGSELVSDVLDDLGIRGVVAASVLKPTLAGRTIVGPALTLRNEPLDGDPFGDAPGARAQGGHINRQADFEAHNLTQPGDVLVIQGLAGVSNIGGISSTMGKRQGGAGAIVWGGIRDVQHSRRIGYPIWSTDVTAVTGKWRQETVAINGPLTIGGVAVRPGDIVVADDSAVCFIPRDRAAEVLERARRKAAMDDANLRLIEEGLPIHRFPRPDPARDAE